jgi:transcriptional regulator with XRE-family HTH domain
MPAEPASLGEIVRAARLARGLTQEQVSAALGVTPEAVQGWEAQATSAKKQKIPAEDHLPKLARLLGVDEGHLAEARLRVERDRLMERMRAFEERAAQILKRYGLDG